MTAQTPLHKATVQWRLAKFYGYAKFADGQEFESYGTEDYMDLAICYDKGDNDLVSMSLTANDDPEAQWYFTEFDDPSTKVESMTCNTIEEARTLLRECFPE